MSGHSSFNSFNHGLCYRVVFHICFTWLLFKDVPEVQIDNKIVYKWNPYKEIPHLCAPYSDDKFLQSLVFISHSAEQCLWPQKEIIIFPRVLHFFSPLNCNYWDMAAALPGAVYNRHILRSALQNSSQRCSAVLFPSFSCNTAGSEVYALLCFYSVWDIYIWCRYRYYFVKNTLFCILIIHCYLILKYFPL